MPSGIPKNGINSGQFKKGDKHPKSWYEKAKEKMSRENNPNWKGGVHSKTRIKYAPRPKPEQCEVCGIFGKDLKKGLYYDHDHTTGQFRGWICGRCNSTLGFVKDNGELLLKLKNYLDKSKQHD